MSREASPLSYSSDLSPGAAAPGEVSFAFSPTGAAALTQPLRDAGLWAGVDRLDPLDRLVLRFHVGDGVRSDNAVFAWVERPPTSHRRVSCERPATPESPTGLDAWRAALLMALPGFRPRPASPRPPAQLAHLLPDGLSTVSAEFGAGPRAVSLQPSLPVALPARPLSTLGIDAALAALRSAGGGLDLVIGVSRLPVDAALRRRLADARARLFEEGFRYGLQARRSQRLAAARLWLGAWEESGHGFALSAAIGAERPLDPAFADAMCRVLFGAPLRLEACPEAVADLTCCVPSRGAPMPPLTPSPRVLAALGFFDPPAPRSSGEAGGLVIGTDLAGDAVSISRRDCSLHTYVVGATGSGKSTLLREMIRQDVAAGDRAVIVVDPHADLYRSVLDDLPDAARSTAILADVADFANPFGLNLLEIDREPAAVQRNFVANQLISVFKNTLYKGVPEAFGPVFETYFRNALFLLMEAGGPEVSLGDFDRVFSEPKFRSDLIDRCETPALVRFWRGIAGRAEGDLSLAAVAPYIVSKLTQLSGNPLVGPIVTARKSTLDITLVMAESRVCLVNLAKGLAGDVDAALLGGLVTIRIFSCAMARAALPPAERRPVRVYMDEVAAFGGGTVAQMLSECRKFGLELVLAGQGLSQVDGRSDRGDIAHAILANVGNVIAMRLGVEDARRMADWFEPEVSIRALSRLPDHTAAVRLVDGGRPRGARIVRTLGLQGSRSL